MNESDDLRETLIAAETCIQIAIRQTTDPSGRAGAASSDFLSAIWILRKWRLALEAGVWTGREPAEELLISRSRAGAE